MNKFVALSALLAFAVVPIVQAALQHGQNNQQKQNKKTLARTVTVITNGQYNHAKLALIRF